MPSLPMASALYRLSSPLTCRRHGLAAASCVLTSIALSSSKTAQAETPSNKKDTQQLDKKKDSSSSTFDFAQSIQDWAASTDAPGFLKDLVNSQTPQSEQKHELPPTTSKSKGPLESMMKMLAKDEDEKETEKQKRTDENGFSSSSSDFIGMAKNFATLLYGRGNQDEALENLVVQARDAAQSGDVKDVHSFQDIMAVWDETVPKMEKMLIDQFGSIDFSYFTPAALFYFLEYEDERKNPSWKRRMHRYHAGVDVKHVADLHHALLLSKLSYDATSTQHLKEELAQDKKHPLKLVYYQPESYPGKPSHFVAVTKGQSMWSNSLEVVMVVRGTKSVEDAITDALLEASSYRGGSAHAGILDSGKWLAKKHSVLFETLLKLSKKKKIRLHLIGHSLGAGTASIAGMEFHDDPKMEVDVIGFGCPALLSKELSEGTKDYITTVVADSDVIPRTSGATIANVSLDIMEYDRYPKLKRDIQQALDELRDFSPALMTESNVKSVMDIVDTNLDILKGKFVKPPTTERLSPVLFPPGSCVHFYRDGSGISASMTPCTFFGEIDITRTMVDDHKISTGYRRIFLDLMRQHRDDENFRFEDLS